jgi:hypothetical protein
MDFKDVTLALTKIRMLLTDLVDAQQVYIDEKKQKRIQIYTQEPPSEGLRKRKKKTYQEEN